MVELTGPRAGGFALATPAIGNSFAGTLRFCKKGSPIWGFSPLHVEKQRRVGFPRPRKEWRFIWRQCQGVLGMRRRPSDRLVADWPGLPARTWEDRAPRWWLGYGLVASDHPGWIRAAVRRTRS